jgi:hypothetical protein
MAQLKAGGCQEAPRWIQGKALVEVWKLMNSCMWKAFLAHLSWKLKWAILIAHCPSVCKLLHFRLLLQNHRANFNQTWHKSSLGEGVLKCSNEGNCFSPRGEKSKNTLNFFLNLLKNQHPAQWNKKAQEPTSLKMFGCKCTFTTLTIRYISVWLDVNGQMHVHVYGVKNLTPPS